MDFFQFLQNSKDTKDTLPVKQEKEEKIIKSSDLTEIKQSYHTFKKGDMVKIVRLENSVLNHYKGYIGEIKEYRKEQEHAIVFLHAINGYTCIKFPLKHLVHHN